MSISAQLPLLVGAVFLVGTPHGALDGRVAEPLLRLQFGQRWLTAFVLLYLAGAGSALVLWLLAPGVSLAAFLLLAALHFGSHDSPTGHPVPVLARGAIPPVLAAAGHREELITIFGWIGGGGGAALVPWLAGPGLLLWLCAALATLIIEQRWSARLELLVAAALFVLLPPLTAFAIYFALVHTPRALAESRRPGESLSALLMAALPFSVAALALAAAGYLLLREQLAAEPALVRTIFWWLGALTVPHLLLGLLSRRSSPTAGARSSQGYRRPAAAG